MGGGKTFTEHLMGGGGDVWVIFILGTYLDESCCYLKDVRKNKTSNILCGSEMKTQRVCDSFVDKVKIVFVFFSFFLYDPKAKCSTVPTFWFSIFIHINAPGAMHFSKGGATITY